MDKEQFLKDVQAKWKRDRQEMPAPASFEELFPLLLEKTVGDGVDLAAFPDLKKNAFGFERYKILKEGHMRMVERFLALYPEQGKSTVKKLVQAIHLDAKYFASFNQFVNIQKEYKKQLVDDETLLTFLEDFRKNSGIFGMYFQKASLFVMESRLIDIPGMDKEIKGLLQEVYGLPDGNKEVYLQLLKLKRQLTFTGIELFKALKAVCHDRDQERL